MTSRRIRVLEVLEATAGGTRKHLVTLLQGLDRDRFDVEVAAPVVRDGHEKDTKFADEVHELGVTFHPVDLHRRVNPVSDFRGMMELAKVMRRGRYDVAHLHSSKAGFLGRVAAKLNGIKTVYTPNGFYFLNATSKLKRRFFLWCERLAGHLTDQMIAVSESERDATVANRAVSPRKIAVIPNAIDASGLVRDPQARRRVREEIGITDDEIVVGTVARFIQQKDPVCFIRTARAVLDRHPKVRFVWCGEGGDLQEETERTARELGVWDSFVFLGFRDDAMDVMNSYDVFALSSIFEGLPYSLLEAMFLELPIAATDVVGSRDIIVDGKTGLLVPPRDPDALAGAICRLIDSADLRRKLGVEARELVEARYSLDRMVAEIEGVYEGLVS